LGFYNKFNFLNKIELNSKVFNRLKGYNDKNIDNNINSSILVNILFLLSKIDSKYYGYFLKEFEKYSIKSIKNSKAVYFLQDYCQNVIDYSNKKGKFIIYEQIMPCGYQQRELIIKECRKLGFDEKYADRFFNIEKIDQNYSNIRSADLVINASELSKSVADEVIGNSNKRNVIIPYGVNFPNTHKSEVEGLLNEKLINLSNRKLKLLYVGSLSILKGTHYLIELMEYFRNNQDIEFGVVGLPSQEQDKIFIEKVKYLNNVVYYGSVPHRNISNIYKQYDMFLFPSLVEGFGMVTLEAMSYGLPCIVNNNCRSIIKQGQDGFIVEEANTHAIIEIIESIIGDKDKIMNMSKNAFQSSLFYSWERYENHLSKLLDETVK
jgi:glycosyltransferase involved in cell wall biosynthesis